MKRRDFFAGFLIACLLILVSGCATTIANMEQRRREKPDVVIRAGKVYEECLPMTPPQVIDYSFTASKPVEFNIHYHGEKAVYPVKGEAVVSWKGIFDPTCIPGYSSEKPPFFCLMWTNPHEEDVGLNYEFTIRDKE
jgi:hypothetical protein